MGLELKLHSPAGAEPLVYSWPLLKSVSFSRRFSGMSLYFARKTVKLQFYQSYVLDSLPDYLSFRMEGMKQQKSWKPSGN